MTLDQFGQLVKGLAPFFQILTSLGVLLGIVTAFIGFSRYQTEKEKDRDQQAKEYLAALRESIFISRPIFDDLNHLLKYELFYEIASEIANSAPVSVGINDVYNATESYALYLSEFKYSSASEAHYFFSSYEEFKASTQENLRRRWNQFGVWDSKYTDDHSWSSDTPSAASLPLPLRPKLVELFQGYTSKIGNEIEPYRFAYPTLSRVLLSANRFFLSLEKKILASCALCGELDRTYCSRRTVSAL